MLMTTSILASIIGIVLFVVSVGLLFNYSYFLGVIKDVDEHPALLYVVSVFRLVIGLLLVFSHTVWGEWLAIIVTVLGRTILLAGVAGMLFPKKIHDMIPFWTTHPQAVQAITVLYLVLGILMAVGGMIA